MSRTHRSYSASSSGSDTQNVPKSFGKSTDYSAKVKKNGSGKYNWGNAYDDIDDFEESSDIAFAHSRRRSNSSSNYGTRPTTSARDFGDVFDEEDEL